MKTSRILLLGAAAVLLAACTKEDMDSNYGNIAGEQVSMTFTAEIPQDAPLTRTQLVEGNAVYWTEGDRIAVWSIGGSTKNEFTAVSIEGSKATFSGEAEEADSYVAVYPYSAAEKDPGTSGSSDYFKFNVPAAQTAVAGTFATNLAPSWAKTTEGSTKLEFHNLCALVKFTIGEDIAGKGTVTFQSISSDDIIAGDGFKYFYNYNNLEKATVNTSHRITLSGTFEAGQSYYMVMAPSYLEFGFSLLFETGDGRLYRKTTGKGFSLEAGKIKNLGTLEASNMEKAMWYDLYKYMPGANPSAIKNRDWTVTLTESDLANMASLTELNLSGKGQSSLSGLAYCTSLQKLDCSNNNLKKLDVSRLTGLIELNCSGNRDLVELNLGGAGEPVGLTGSMDKSFTSLRAGSGSSLQKLNCSNTGIRRLDLSGMTELIEVDCSNNYSNAELILSGLTKLEILNCDRNYYVTELDLSGLTSLRILSCYYLPLNELDVNGLPELTELSCGQNDFKTLTIRGLNKLTKLQCSMGSNLSELNLSELPALQELNCSSIELTTLDVSELTGLRKLNCAQNYKLKILNVNGLDNLEELVCAACKLSNLDLTGITTLKKIDCTLNNIPALDITEQGQLENLLCGEQSVEGDKGGVEPLELTLTLTSAQKTKWESIWVNEKWGNSNVILNVKN